MDDQASSECYHSKKHVNFLTVTAKKNFQIALEMGMLLSVMILVIKLIKTIFDNCYRNLKYFKLHWKWLFQSIRQGGNLLYIN